MKDIFSRIMKAAACCLTILCSIALTADVSANQMTDRQENYASWRRSVLEDDGMLQNFVNALWDGTFLPGEYTVSSKYPLPEPGTLITSEYDTYDTVIIDLSVNVPVGESALFYTKSPADAEAAAAVLQTYYPNGPDKYSRPGQNCFCLTDSSRITLNRIRQELDDAGLLTAFYFHVPAYQRQCVFMPYLTCYPEDQLYGAGSRRQVSASELREYLDKHDLHCSVITETDEPGVRFAVVPDKPLFFEEHWNLALRLYHDLGIVPLVTKEWYGMSDPDYQTGIGIPFDVNADAAFRTDDADILCCYLLTADSITDPQAGDLNFDGKLNAADLTLIKRALISENQSAPNAMTDPPISALNPSLPSAGKDRIPVFAVSFPDCAFSVNRISEQLQTDFFSEANPDSPRYPHESVAGFYERASYGSMELTGDIYEYTAAHPISWYAAGKGQKLVHEIMERFDEQVDYRAYDADGNQILDAFVLVLPDEAFLLDSDADSQPDWWPFTAVSAVQTTYDGIRVRHYCTVTYKQNNRANFIGTAAHELGHALGLPDYYKYSTDQAAEEGLTGDAGYELMDDNSGDLSACSKLLLGWITEDAIQVYSGGTQTFLLRPSTDAPSCILIPKEPDAGFLSEYFLIEYITPDGNQPVYGGSGVRILHVQAEVSDGLNGPELTYSNYGQHYDSSNQKQRVLRLVNENGCFHPDGEDTVDGTTAGFHWYDADGALTADTGLRIEIGALHPGSYYDLSGPRPADCISGICQITVSDAD